MTKGSIFTMIAFIIVAVFIGLPLHDAFSATWPCVLIAFIASNIILGIFKWYSSKHPMTVDKWDFIMGEVGLILGSLISFAPFGA